MVSVQDNDERELMLAKLHCNESTLEKLRSTLDVTGAELQRADTDLQSLAQRLADSKQNWQRLQNEYCDAEEILCKEVVFYTI